MPITSPLLIEFGSPEWQARIGGDFFGPETNNDFAWNWLGGRAGWVVLPGMDPSRDYRLEVEAAPIAVHAESMWEIVASSPNGTELDRWAVPLTAHPHQFTLSPGEGGNVPIRFDLRKLPPPELEVQAGTTSVARLIFEYAPELQTRDFILRREFITPELAITFVPNYAVAPAGTAKTSDERRLSFRFVRLRVSAIEA